MTCKIVPEMTYNVWIGTLSLYTTYHPTNLQNVFCWLFLIFSDPEREEAGNSECVEFLQSILEIPYTSLPVDSPSSKLSVNEIKQWLCTERLYCLIDVQT